MLHSCVHCGKVFKSHTSLDKHAGRCKNKQSKNPLSVARTNISRRRKRARSEPPDEDDNLFTGHDIDDHDQVRTLNHHTSLVE